MSAAQQAATISQGPKAPKASPLVVMGARYSIDPANLLDVLKATAFKGQNNKPPSNEECAALCIVANQYGLNPFTREIYAFPAKGGGIVPIVGVDGWARVVNNHELFDGCEFEEHHDETGSLVATTCTMYAKGRSKPVKVTEYFRECVRSTDPWKNMPHRMLRHKSFMQAGRLCFGLSGLYDEDEGRDFADLEPKTVTTLPAGKHKVKQVTPTNGNGSHPAIISEQTEALLAEEFQRTGADPQTFLDAHGVPAIKKLSEGEAQRVLADLRKLPEREPVFAGADENREPGDEG